MERSRKRELRELNSRAWVGQRDIFPTQASLDSSLKKNTAFIKRVRTSITSSPLTTFLQEIRSLSLEKYLSEIVSAAYDGLTKLKTPAEVAAGVEVVSALHQRFGPTAFTVYLAWYVGRGLSTPDKAHLKALSQDVREREEKERLIRQRVLLRVATELWLVNVFRSLDDIARPEEAGKTKEGTKSVENTARVKPTGPDSTQNDGLNEPFPLEVLKDLLGHDKEHVNLPLVVLFVKTFAWDILGVEVSGSEGRKTVGDEGHLASATRTDEDSPTPNVENGSDDAPIAPPELRQLFKNVISRYFEDVKSHIVKGHKALLAQGRKNAEAYVRSGEVFEDRQANYDKQLKTQDRLIASAQILADAVGLEMPDLHEKESNGVAGDGIIGLVKTGEYLRGHGDGAGIWEDEDERRFYENIVDLRDRVPGILLEDVKKKKSENEEPSIRKPADAEVAASKEEAVVPEPEDDQSMAIASKSVGAQVDTLLLRLPEFNNKDSVDECAIDFCFLNSKASRNRLIKALQDVPKGRSDLLPFYSRLIATVGKYLTDVPQGVVAHLDDEFRSLQRRKSKEFLGQVRLQNVRYLAELTKFGVVPEHVIFHCFRVCLDDFSRLNIEIVSSLLENCGRYLLRNPETSPRMSSFLDTLSRKKAAQHLGQQERMILENAIYFVNPPERAAIEQKERTPIDLYIRKLIYGDLNKKNADKVLRQIRKLHWEEPEVVAVLHKVFSKPSKVKYNHIHLLAVMLGSLNRYHQAFAIRAIDDLLESITLGLEMNDFKMNQRRIAEVKYLAELYIYRMVDSPLIFDTLYKILTFGHEAGLPKAGALNVLDLPDDYFRIRLVCSLLDSCGMFFDKGQARKKLDFFLTFLQYYVQLKDPLPLEIDFLIQDTFALLRPDWKRLGTLEEAGQAFAEAVKLNYEPSLDRATEADEADEDLESEDDGEDDELMGREREDRDLSGDEEEDDDAAQDNEAEEVETSDEEEHIVVTKPQDERDPEAEAEFDREFAKLMSESLDSRKFERKPLFDVALPIRKVVRDSNVNEEQTNGTEAADKSPGMMKFSLLSKRGNKQQTREIDLPSNSTFAVAMRNQQQAEREEQQRIKNLVLNYDLRDETDGADGEFHPLLPINTNRKLFTYFNSKRANGAERSKQCNAPLTLASTPASSQDSECKTNPGQLQGMDKQPQNPYLQPRADKSGSNRANQRARKLQLNDLDWT